MVEVKVESHQVGVTSYRLTSLSFHVNRPSYSWDTAFSTFDLENPRSRSWVRGKLKATTWIHYSLDSHPFLSMSIGPSIHEIQHFQNLTLKIQDQGQMTMTLHNYRSRQFHRTSNGINPSSGFRDMGSAMSGPSAAWFEKFLAHGQAHMGQMGKWPWQCTTTGLDNSSELRMEKIRQAVTEIWVPQVWQPPARPPARTVTTIPLQPEGLRGKKNINHAIFWIL